MKRKSLSFRLEQPTEEELLAEIEEFFTSLSLTLRDFTVADFIAAAKIFFAPVTRKALQRTKAEQRSLGKEVGENQKDRSRYCCPPKAETSPLSAATSEKPLADAVSKELKQQGIIRKVDTVRHWLAESSEK